VLCWQDSAIRVSEQRFSEDSYRLACNEIYRIIRFRNRTNVRDAKQIPKAR